MRHQNTRGIIINKHNSGEQDIYVTFFSPTHGRIEAMAKGARKIDSSFTGHLELLNICNIQIYKSSHRYTLTQCQSNKTFLKLRDDLKLSMSAFILIEIFNKIIHSEEYNEQLFTLLVSTLTNLDNKDKNALFIENYKIKILKIAGALPDISTCSNCNHRWINNETIVISNDGQIHCKKCYAKNQSSIEIQYNIMKLINYLSNSEKIIQITITKPQKIVLNKICNIFLENYLSNTLNSEKIATQFANLDR